jgi:hypothetical protein
MASDRDLLSQILWRLQRIEKHLGIPQFEAFSDPSEESRATAQRFVYNPEPAEPWSPIGDRPGRLVSITEPPDSSVAKTDPPEEPDRSDD